MVRLFKTILLIAVALVVAACDPRYDLGEPPKKEFGPFLLGHNITVARNPTIGPTSVNVTEAEWQEVIQGAIAERFGRYRGDRLYHFGISVDGYVVSVIPPVRSFVFLTVTLWDDALGRKLNPEAEEIVVVSSEMSDIPGSTKDKLLHNLGGQIALAVQKWMLEHPDWFTPPFE